VRGFRFRCTWSFFLSFDVCVSLCSSSSFSFEKSSLYAFRLRAGFFLFSSSARGGSPFLPGAFCTLVVSFVHLISPVVLRENRNSKEQEFFPSPKWFSPPLPPQPPSRGVWHPPLSEIKSRPCFPFPPKVTALPSTSPSPS